MENPFSDFCEFAKNLANNRSLAALSRLDTEKEKRTLRAKEISSNLPRFGLSQLSCYQPKFPRVVTRLTDTVNSKILEKPLSFKRNAEPKYVVTDSDLKTARASRELDSEDLVPTESPVDTAVLFLDAYRAAVRRYFGVTLTSKWNPLLVGSYTPAPLLADFRVFVGHFVANRLEIPHAWVFYRFSTLIESHASGKGGMSEVEIRKQLGSYRLFFRILSSSCVSKPAYYVRYRKNTLLHFKSHDRRQRVPGADRYQAKYRGLFDTLMARDEALAECLEFEELYKLVSCMVEKVEAVNSGLKHKALAGYRAGKWVWTHPVIAENLYE